MYTMHEALARERMREQHRKSKEMRVARELAVARRWRRREMRASETGWRARVASRRHAMQSA